MVIHDILLSKLERDGFDGGAGSVDEEFIGLLHSRAMVIVLMEISDKWCSSGVPTGTSIV